MTARAVQPLTDRAVLRDVLRRDPIANAYMLGDLDDTYTAYCTWYGSTDDSGYIDALMLVYTGLSAPVLLSCGDSLGVDAIIKGVATELPERAHVHMEPDHLAAYDQQWAVDRLRPMVRMGLKAAEFRAPTAGPWEVLPLAHRDTGDIMELCQHYPDSFFEPSQLSTGHYYGIRIDGRLVSVAGVHIHSRADRLAALGNIVTHPDHRGHGLSTTCTAHLCARLISEGTELLALNVERRNASAVHVYEKLGFHEQTTYLEGFVTRTLAKKIRHDG